MIRFGRETCENLDDAMTREWLETNGIGGFASSTICGLNTRRYHALLVAATKPPVGRVVLLSKLEETLVVGEQRFELSANQYPGAIHPEGFKYQTEFRLDPFPVFTYRAGGIEVEKSVFMVQGENTACVQYDLRVSDSSPKEKNEDEVPFVHHPSPIIHLEVRPLVAFRDYHSLGQGAGEFDERARLEDGVAIIAPRENLPALYLAHDADSVESAGLWYRNFEYRVERERGFEFREDLFNPLVFKFDLSRRARASVVASTEHSGANRADEYRRTEIARRRSIVAATPAHDDEFIRALVAAADQFIVARGRRQTIIAGYHWFSDWGRDTMIALPGLTLSTGRFDVARSILLEFARHVSEGMLPNRFPDEGESPDYNTADATLWFFEAARSLRAHSGDAEFVRAQLYEILKEIIEWHARGTRYGIHVDADGLLAAGAAGSQLTWMDAKVGDWVVTPRRGKPVEIQALWYNALRILEDFAREFADAAGAKLYSEMAARAAESFNQKFWNDEAGCLYDVIDGETKDASVRPNQIFAASLPHSMLARERALNVVAVVRRELLTPYGLRTLSPSDPNYRGRYEGDVLERDGAYHQGTVWAWLWGAFVDAYVKISEENPAQARAQVAEWLAPFRAHLNEAGLGQISEIFDGDAPHTPRGCIAQAWSVGELLRVAFKFT